MSEFERPSRASEAICASFAVSGRRWSTLRRTIVSPAARSSRAARAANASIPMSTKCSCASRSCSRASKRSTRSLQPFAVDKLRASEFHPDPSAGEALGSLAGERLRGLAVAQQRSRPSLDPQSQLGASRLCCRRESPRAPPTPARPSRSLRQPRSTRSDPRRRTRAPPDGRSRAERQPAPRRSGRGRCTERRAPSERRSTRPPRL